MKNCLNLFFVIILFGCSSEPAFKETEFVKAWRLSEVISMDGEDDEVNELLKLAFEEGLLEEGYVLYFFPDKRFTELTGYSIEAGNWEFDGKELKFGDKKILVERLEEKRKKEFLIGDIMMEEESFQAKLKWVKEVEMLETFKMDPFYPKNNLWRKKPSQKENEEQIRERLLNYVLHFAYILKASTEREHNVVSFAHSMGIIRVYRGGIGIVKIEQIKEEWKNCFFDEEDAMKAYDLFKSYLNRGVYKGGTTGDWVKDDYKILMSVYRKIKNKEREGEE